MAEAKIRQMLWKIDYNDIVPLKSSTSGNVSLWYSVTYGCYKQ